MIDLSMSTFEYASDYKEYMRVSARSKNEDQYSIEKKEYTRHHVAILLAVYNGAKHLPDQLHSFKRQTNSDWSLLISDDGSNDKSMEIAACFAKAERGRSIKFTSGPMRGFSHNFMHLLNMVDPQVPYVAFSDQDDAWLPEKLEQGIVALSRVADDVPAIYCGRTWVCSATLRKVQCSPEFEKAPGFRNAIVQNIGGGNTMILNAAAVELVRTGSKNVTEVVSHDWWVYQLVTGAGGEVIFDNEPMVLYRQHSGNVVGAGVGLLPLVWRLWMVLAGKFQAWNSVNEIALLNAAHVLTQENRLLLQDFYTLRRSNPLKRMQMLRYSGIHHQTMMGTVGLWLAAILKRI